MERPSSREADGDTLYRIKTDDGRTIKVREWTADAPEIAHSKSEVDQPGGREALDYVSAHWKGKKITVTVKGHSYDRIVGQTVAQGETRALGLDLVAHGYAQVYPKTTPKPTHDYLDAQDDAKKKRLGIWKSDTPPVAPWDWRAQQREKQRSK
jgi:endonuclease YncB( thermonuclease family)